MKITEIITESTVEEAEKKGLYYYVNLRKKKGISRDKDDPKAPSAQDWKNAAKTAKTEDIDPELVEEFDLIESIINRLAEHNGVDAEVIWEDLETLSEDELYAFAVTSEPIMESHQRGEYSRVLTALRLYFPRLSMEELNTPGYYKVIANKADVPVEYAAQVIDDFANVDRYYDDDDDEEDNEEQGVAEDWQKANKRDKTDGMSQKAVNAYRRENPGSKLKTAVTTKPSKLKRGSKASKRRSSYCSRSRGQMKMHSISCSKTPDKAICKARRRWNC